MTSLRDEPIRQRQREPEPITVTYEVSGGDSIERALHRLAACSSVTGPDLYHAIVHALTDALGARWALIGFVDPRRPGAIHTVAVIADGAIQDDLDYDFEGTPCAEVLAHGTRCFSGDLKRRFPNDHILHEMGVQYYLGAPLRGSDGSIFGLVAVQHDGPLDESLQPTALLELLAGRAAAALELERNVEALERNERNLADFFDNSAVGLHWVNRDGFIIRVNRAELEMMGYAGREQEYLGRHITDFHADAPVIDDILARLARGETLQDYPARLMRRDGSIRHVLITSNALFENGQFVHTRCFTRDVTEQRKAEEALRRSEEFNRRLIDSSSDCIKVLDLDGRLLSMSEGGRRRMGIDDLSEYRNKSWIDWWTEHRSQAEEAVRAAAAGGAGTFEGSCPAVDGTPHWWEIIITPILGANGRPERLLAVSRDITHRREAEEQLRESQAQLRTITDNAASALFMMGKQGRPIFMNAAAEKITGYTLDEIRDRPLHDSIHHTRPDGSPYPMAECPIDIAAEKLTPIRQHEDVFVRKDGTLYPIVGSVAPIVQDGRNVGAVIEFRDVTEQREQERALRESEERYRTLVELLPAAVYLCNADGTIAAFNRRAAEIWGREPKIGDTDQRFCGALRLHWPDGRPLPHEKTPMAECLVDGIAKRDLEVVIERPDSSRITVLVNISPLHDEQGNVIGAINCFQDITQRKRDEQLLQQQFERLHVLYDLIAAVGRADRLDDVYEAALDGLRDALGANRASILLYDDTGVMRFTAWRGLSDGYRAAVEGHSPWSPDETDPQPVFIEDVEQAELGDLREVVLGEGIRALGFFPLTHHGRLLGKFMVYHETPHDFNEEEVRLAKTIASHVSFAIERHRTSDELRRREEEFRALSEHSPDIIARFDPDFRHLYVNSAIESLAGFKGESLLHRTSRELGMPPNLCDQWEAAIAEVFVTAAGKDIEFAFSAPDGVRHFMGRLTPEFGPDGEVASVLGVTRDITARKQAEQQRERLIAELSLERTRLTEIFERTTSFMFVFRGPDHVYEFANPAYFRLVNRDESIIGKPLRDAFPEIENQGYMELLDRVYATGERIVGHERPVTLRDNEGERTIFVDFVFEPLHDVDGTVTGILVQGVDLTAHVEARRKIEEFAKKAERSRADLQAIIASMNEGLITCDPDGGNLFMNEAARRIYGYGPRAIDAPPIRLDDYRGRYDVRTLAGREVAPEDWPITRALRGDSFTGDELVVHRTDTGATFVGRFSATPVRDRDGNIVRAVVTVSDITAARRAQEAQSRLAAIVETSEDSIISKTLDGLITSWNRGAERTFGYTADEAIGQPITLIIPPERLDEEDRIRERVRDGRRVEPYETLRITKDGRRLDISLTVSPIIDDAGRIVGASKIARDITERKRAEAQLRESEARLTLALEAGRMGAWEWDINAGAVRWSPGLEAIHGLKPGTFGGTFEDFASDIHGDDRERVLEAIHNAVERGAPYHVEYRILAADGAMRWIEARGRIIRDNTGTLNRMAGVCMDVTERKQAAEEAHRQFAFRQAVENSVAAGLVAIDPDGRITYVNRAFSEMTGFGTDVALGKTPPFPWWPREDVSRYKAMFEAMVRGEAPTSGFEARYLRRDGSPLDVLINPSPLIGADGQITGYLAAITDITQQKKNEHELARHRDQLEELVIERTVELEASYEQLRQTERMAALGTLSAGLGHDMGNLLLPLRLRLDAIERKTQEPESSGQNSAVNGQNAEADLRPPTSDVREDIEAIRKCAEYMQRLTNGLRLFALDPNDDQASDDTTDLHQWWNDVEPFLKNALPRGVELERRLADDLPRLGVARHLLTQAIFNLVQNAGDAVRSRMEEEATGEERAGCVCVLAEFDHRQGVVRLGVSDDGPGMTADVRKRCMEPFFTTKPRGLSTGLGLALVHGIVLRARGRMEIDSSIGQGTTMTLVLPVCDRHFASTESEADSPAGANSESRPQALVTIAEPRIRAFATSVLRALSVEVLSFEDEPAKESASVDAADLWLTDDVQRVGVEAPRLFAADELKRIVLVAAPPDAPRQPDDRIVLLDPAEGRPGCWRTLRSVIAEMRSRSHNGHTDGP